MLIRLRYQSINPEPSSNAGMHMAHLVISRHDIFLMIRGGLPVLKPRSCLPCYCSLSCKSHPILCSSS
ncbi:hypothetical protein OPV22_000621 [Ensete ventricosum]|uniref:Uncharacterized protein n=1 Tax=Ensete ventricosum TaxID=4639 RepID=A0AAV8RVJ4_ENSVE|nr:hypothetical protein OPV22_000621 [Ensete ventricosum]